MAALEPDNFLYGPLAHARDLGEKDLSLALALGETVGVDLPMAEMALTNLGWNVVNLGPNTPLRSFRAALAQLRPRLVWLSIGHLVDPESFVKQYRELYQEASRRGIAVAIGGRALTEGIRSEIPCTTFGDGLTHLVQFARSLHPSAGRPRRGRPPGT